MDEATKAPAKAREAAASARRKNEAVGEELHSPPGNEQPAHTHEDEGKAVKDAESESPTPAAGAGESGVRLRVRSTTGAPRYYRQGYSFGPRATDIQVAAELAVVLETDPWLVVERLG